MKLIEEMATLTSTEQFMEFFGVDYEETTLQTIRIRLLKRFNRYKESIDKKQGDIDDQKLREQYSAALSRSYTELKEEPGMIMMDLQGGCFSCTKDCSL